MNDDASAGAGRHADPESSTGSAAGSVRPYSSGAMPAGARTGPLTTAVHVGNEVDEGTGAVRTPLVLANSYALPYDPSQMSWSNTEVPFYTRNSGVNQLALQRKLAALEGAEDAVVLASGVAALHGIFFAHLRSGDHVVVSDVSYEAIFRLFSDLLPRKYGIEADFVDTADPDAVRAAMRGNTRLVHLETPANPTTKITDVRAIADIAHGSGALVSVDSTFATPLLMRPLELGADFAVHSLTKYINGHGDAMGGAVLGSRALIEPVKADAMVDVGGVISPFNAWLIGRGAITLPLRMRQHCANAQAVAELLEADPRVAYVYYPGLRSHPQHELAARQMHGGFGGMLAFAVDGGPEAQNRFVDALRLVTSAVSLGHDESLIVHVSGDGPRVAPYPEVFKRYGHLRFSAGIEDTEDLIEDFRQALDAACGA